MLKSLALSRQRLVLLVSVFLVLFDNTRFFERVVATYPPSLPVHILYIASTAVLLLAVTYFLLTLLTPGKLLKPVLVLVLLVSSAVSYFMNAYHVVIDHSMIRNVLETDMHEAGDLLSPKLFLYLLLLGIVPSLVVLRVRVSEEPLRSQLLAQGKALALSLAVSVTVILLFGKFYASFFREHRPLRYHTNPAFWIYNVGYYINDRFFKPSYTFQRIGTDARIPEGKRRTIVIFVVGEAARADHFSLNGYARATTPKLAQERLINYANMYSCGTSTAHSVPCMFSVLDRARFDYEKAYHTENVLDVLKHTGRVALLWRDNNSDSKGVAERIAYERYSTSPPNPVCDIECRDVGMLDGLDRFIDTHADKHVMIVLHQMGNHGPAYYKRYPKAFERFGPVCQTPRLETCSRESIVNAYDNALLYTDAFLARVIALAKRYPNANVAVFYVADHGESLGENGLYLHGLPYFIAPDAQKHVGAFLWLNDTFGRDLNMTRIRAKARQRVSHDWIFHTLLGLFGVQSDVYDKRLDLIH